MIRRVHRERSGKCIGVVSIRPIDVPPNWIERSVGHPDTSSSISEQVGVEPIPRPGSTDLTINLLTLASSFFLKDRAQPFRTPEVGGSSPPRPTNLSSRDIWTAVNKL